MNIINGVDFDYYAKNAENEAAYFVKLSERITDIRERFEQGVEHFGDPLPWRKTHDLFRLRAGEVTLWAGISGHGKSLITSQVATHLIRHKKTLIASLEMPVATTGHRMLRQIIGTSNPTTHFIYRACSWTSPNLWLYDQLDTVPSQRIIGMCVYAATQLGIEHIFIDSLMKCGIDEDDFKTQKSFVDRLTWIAKHFGVHIHLVHHIRKPPGIVDETRRPSKFDIRGTSSITDLVDNILIPHRNKRKEKDPEKYADEPDQVLACEKQRNGEAEPVFKLWLHNESQQYVEWDGARPYHFDLDADKLVERSQANG